MAEKFRGGRENLNKKEIQESLQGGNQEEIEQDIENDRSKERQVARERMREDLIQTMINEGKAQKKFEDRRTELDPTGSGIYGGSTFLTPEEYRALPEYLDYMEAEKATEAAKKVFVEASLKDNDFHGDWTTDRDRAPVAWYLVRKAEDEARQRYQKEKKRK